MWVESATATDNKGEPAIAIGGKGEPASASGVIGHVGGREESVAFCIGDTPPRWNRHQDWRYRPRGTRPQCWRDMPSSHEVAFRASAFQY